MRWTLKPKPDPEIVSRLAGELGVEKSIAFLLVQRGIHTFEEAKKFFRPSLQDLHDPYLMADMEKAVARIQSAVANGEHMLVYGDYDVDGTTSVALMSTFLKKMTPKVSCYIPDRYQEGYGISCQGIDFATEKGISLIIALDCGIKAKEKVAYAAGKGIDFIICDHHRPGGELPRAVAVLDPKRQDCAYPYKELCGCGVGFKLIQALSMAQGDSVEVLVPYLDLVATAIGADIVPVTGENRILAYHGLQVINKSPRMGFRAILAQVKKQQITLTDLMFIIAPRINAAGRMKHGLHAVDLLTEVEEHAAQNFAGAIEQFNSERRIADQTITREALEQISLLGEQDGYTTVVYREDWHKGVIGIVASRLIETYYRPTLVFTKSGDKLAASARSVKGFDVYDALEACRDHIEQFGGHKYAAGLTLEPSEYENFKRKFETVVAKTIEQRMLTPELSIDAELSLDQITPKFQRILKQFEPFGPGNPSPLFMSRNLRDTGLGKCVGAKGTHLKCAVTQIPKGPVFEMIGFNLGGKAPIIQHEGAFQAVYAVDENRWNGRISLQLKLKDIAEDQGELIRASLA